jgi:hypothetical protein
MSCKFGAGVRRQHRDRTYWRTTENANRLKTCSCATVLGLLALCVVLSIPRGVSAAAVPARPDADVGTSRNVQEPFLNSTSSENQGSVPHTRDGKGYWLVASDGGIFSFGDARFLGSMGGIHLNRPVVGIVADDVSGGYWEVATDGGIFAFHAPFYGSTGNARLNQPIVGISSTPDGKGYWLVARDGGIFAFGDAPFYGSTGNVSLSQPIVGVGDL